MTNLTETVPCPLCGATAYAVIYPARYPPEMTREELLRIYSSSSDHQLMDQMVRCNACSFHYLNPRVKSDIILDSYSNAVDPVFMQQNPMRIQTFRRSLKKLIRRFAIRPDAAKRVLDIGSAGGAFPKAAADFGFSVIGVEPSAWLCDEGRKAYHLDLRAGTFEQQSFPPKHFFMITLWDVLEHLPDPAHMLASVRPLLRDDGYLVINLPNSDSLMSRVLGSRWPFLLSVHLSYFTPKTLERMLAQQGYRVLSVSPHFQTLELGYAMKRAASYFSWIGWIERGFSKIGLSRVPLVYNMGQMMMVAQKQ